MKNAIADLFAGVSVWLATWTFDRNITSIYLFAPINVLVACAIGTYCAFAWEKDPITDRKKMWRLAFACFFMGTAFTVITNALLGFFVEGLHMSDGLQSAIGAVVSYVTRSALPWLRDTAESGSWVNYIPLFRKRDSE